MNLQGFLDQNQELADTGLTVKEVEEEIYKAANRHGGGEGVLKAIADTESLRSIVARVPTYRYAAVRALDNT